MLVRARIQGCRERKRRDSTIAVAERRERAVADLDVAAATGRARKRPDAVALVRSPERSVWSEWRSVGSFVSTYRLETSHRAAESGCTECAELLAAYDPLSARLADERDALPEELAQKAVHDDISELLAAFHNVPISVLEIVDPDAMTSATTDAIELEEPPLAA